jgi:hypothetical protein
MLLQWLREDQFPIIASRLALLSDAAWNWEV